MHEVKIVEEILNELREISSQKNARVVKAKILIGDLNRPNNVEKWLKKSKDEDFKDTKFEVIKSPAKVSCECGYSGEIKSVASYPTDETVLEMKCPHCGSQKLELTGGLEKEILEVKLEETPHG